LAVGAYFLAPTAYPGWPPEQDGDGGHVGQGRFDVGAWHLARLDVEQVEGADDRAPQTQRQGVD